MKSKIFLITCLLFLSNLYPQDVIIKSLKYYTSSETGLPVIVKSEGGYGSLTIEFDMQSVFMPDMNIVFRFCDRNWHPTDNLFLINYTSNIVYNLDVSLLPNTVEEAKYHFKGSFPNRHDKVEFPYSGKWMFFVTDAQDTSIVFTTGKFYVVEPLVDLGVSIKREELEDETFFPADLKKIFNITASFILPSELTPGFVDHVEIIENEKIYYPVIIDRNFNTNRRQYYWNGNDRFSFTARDIRPGNEYRQTDFRNHKRFSGKLIDAQFDGLEYSRFYEDFDNDLNGSFLLTNYRNEYATYLDVNFSIRPPDENFGSIFLTGAFNDWQVLPEYRMINQGGIYSLTIPLKRGVYDYQYVTGDIVNGKVVNQNWYILEGNTWDTSNEYNIFLYYKDPNFGGYDRIIGYRRILSR